MQAEATITALNAASPDEVEALNATVEALSADKQALMVSESVAFGFRRRCVDGQMRSRHLGALPR